MSNISDKNSTVKARDRQAADAAGHPANQNVDGSRRVGLGERLRRAKARRCKRAASGPPSAPASPDERAGLCQHGNGHDTPAPDKDGYGDGGGQTSQESGGPTESDTVARKSEAVRSDSVTRLFAGLTSISIRPTPDQRPILSDAGDHQFICASPFVVRSAAGGVAGLFLSQMVYWLSPASDGLPRWRPQPDFQEPSWNPGYVNAARLIGLQTCNRKYAEAKIRRAIDRLTGNNLIESFSLHDEPPKTELDWPYCLSDRRQQNRLSFRLTVDFSSQLREKGLLQQSARGLPVVKVWRADVHELDDPNQAVTLGQLWHHCVSNSKQPKVNKYGENRVAKPNKQLAKETGLTVDQVRAAIEKLQRERLILVEVFRFKGSKTQHFRITEKN